MKKLLIFLLMPTLAFAAGTFCEDEAKAYTEQIKIANEAEELFEKNKTEPCDIIADYFAVIEVYTSGLKALQRPERVVQIFERFQNRGEAYAYATRICFEISQIIKDVNVLKAKETHFLSLIKEAKKKSKGGTKDFEKSLFEVLKNGNPLVKPSPELSKITKELLDKTDKNKQ